MVRTLVTNYKDIKLDTLYNVINCDGLYNCVLKSAIGTKDYKLDTITLIYQATLNQGRFTYDWDVYEDHFTPDAGFTFWELSFKQEFNEQNYPEMFL